MTSEFTHDPHKPAFNELGSVGIFPLKIILDERRPDTCDQLDYLEAR